MTIPVKNNPYPAGALWKSRKGFEALRDHDGKVEYIKGKEVIFLLSSICDENFIESIMFLYNGKKYYAYGIDVSHTFDFMQEQNGI